MVESLLNDAPHGVMRGIRLSPEFAHAFLDEDAPAQARTSPAESCLDWQAAEKRSLK
jgi:hypothetical protein